MIEMMSQLTSVKISISSAVVKNSRSDGNIVAYTNNFRSFNFRVA